MKLQRQKLKALSDTILELYRPRTGPVHHRHLVKVLAQAFSTDQMATYNETDKEIAHTIGNSPRTVHHQLESIYRKLGVRNRTEAIRRLLEQIEIGMKKNSSPL